MATRNPGVPRVAARLATVLLVELMVPLLHAGPLPEVTCEVGGRAVLPCSWGETPAHVEWMGGIPYDTVYQKWGVRTWAAPEYRGRAGIPDEQLAVGDCSLVLLDAQLLDGGVYDSYGVRGDGRLASRVPVHTVRLSVRDHKLQRSVHEGDDLVVQLHTPHAQRVVFQGRNGSAWGLLWLRGGSASPRVQQASGREEVVLASVSPEDQGFYKVLDRHGLAVSTLLLHVHETPQVSAHQQDKQEHHSPVQNTAAWARSPGFLGLLLLLWFCVSMC